MEDEGDENRESKDVKKDQSESDDNCNDTEVPKEDESVTTHSSNPAIKDTSFKVPIINKNINTQETGNEKQKQKEKVPELRYKEPWWSATPRQEDNYNLEILKNGCIISTIDLNDKPYHVFGRLPLCDVVLEHPSISRYHAVIQYRGETDGDKTLSGFYLHDLGSTHGTMVNKVEIKSKTYYRLKVGYVIKFGGSSRLFVLQGPTDEEEDENETAPSLETSANTTTIKTGQIFTDEEYESLKKVEKKSDSSEGIDWGFGEDAEEEQIDSEKFEELYSGVEFKDPKKTLRGYYEREGLELEYQVDETGPGHARVYHCRVRLPVDGPNGSAVYAEASVTGRKKEAVRECANEACKMLDAYGLLRQSNHESRKKRERNWEEDDFYESDEDNFLDRTGTVETKRLKRMRKVGKEKSEADTYSSLLEKLHKVQKEVKGLEKQISDAEAVEENDDGDSLDNFMNTISQRMDKETKIKLKRRIAELRKDEQRITKMVSLAKPTTLPSLQSSSSKDATPMAKKTENIGGKLDLLEKQEDEEKDSEKDMPLKSTKDELNSGHPSLEEKPQSVSSSKTAPISKSFNDFAMPTRTATPAKSKFEKSQKISKTSDEDHNSKERGIGDKETPQDKTNTRNEQEAVKQPSKTKTGQAETGKKSEPKENSEVAKKKKRYTVPTQWEDANDPNFANWMPPQDQSGDGRTKLNDKYGY